MKDLGRTRVVIVAIGAAILLVVAPLLFLSGAGLAAPSPTPSPAPPSPAAAPSPGAPTVIVVEVTRAQEVPAPAAQTPATAAGTGAIVINAARTEVGFAFTFTGLSGNLMASHFHRAERGVAGPVIQTICGAPEPGLSGGACPAASSGTVAGVWRIPAGMVADLLAGRLYVNFHTALNPEGEIRGQITPTR